MSYVRIIIASHAVLIIFANSALKVIQHHKDYATFVEL